MPNLLPTIRQTPHRGAAHLFLGHPLADACDKTTVEPGNVFSPGVWSCGIALYVQTPAALLSPEHLPHDAIAWSFAPPVVESRWTVDTIRVHHRLTTLGGAGCHGTDFADIAFAGPPRQAFRAHLVVRDLGPAGARIRALHWQAPTLTINTDCLLTPETLPTSIALHLAAAENESSIAVLTFDLVLDDAGAAALRFRVEHGFGHLTFGSQLPSARPHQHTPVTAAFAQAAADWPAALPARVFAPDPRIAATWNRCAAHLLAAMECGLPRVGTVNYPVFWLRDGVIILRALDLLHRPDLARIGNDCLAPTTFGGGFGAESDAPGQAIWALTSHARITHDDAWLRRIFPHLQHRAQLLLQMKSTPTPLRAVTENRIPFYQHTPGINVFCLPTRDGVIRGRMDWHTPDFFINCWAVAGLRRAAGAASRLGHADLAATWLEQAHELEHAVAAVLLPAYGNPRDPIITPYPSQTLATHPALKAAFQKWYESNRLTPGRQRLREPLWTDFEAAQIHNAFLLGLPDLAWINLDGMLSDRLVPSWDTSTYVEGEPNGNEMLPFRNGEAARGWLDPTNAFAGNMPHNWTNAEMINLLRDLFVREDGDHLLLAPGAPASALTPGSRFGVENLPTDFGPISYTVEVTPTGAPRLTYSGPQNHRLAPHIASRT